MKLKTTTPIPMVLEVLERAEPILAEFSEPVKAHHQAKPAILCKQRRSELFWQMSEPRSVRDPFTASSDSLARKRILSPRLCFRDFVESTNWRLLISCIRVRCTPVLNIRLESFTSPA